MTGLDRAKAVGVRRAGRLAVFLSALLVLANSAAVAQRTGSRLGREASLKDAVTAMRMIAECFYDREPKDTHLWLDTLPGDPRETKLLQRDAANLTPCLDSDKIVFDGKAVSMKPAVLRRSVGAAMARRVLMTSPHPAAPAPDTRPWFAEALAKLPAGAAVNRSSLAIQEFGHCVAIARWDDSVALIKSNDDSTDEKAAVARIVPVLSGCLDAGDTIHVTARNLREIVGEPVYHLLQARALTSGRLR